MIQVRDVLGRARPLAVAAVFTAAAFLPIVATHFASAGALKNRSLMVTSTLASDVPVGSAAAGDSNNGTAVGHTYAFDTSTVGSVATVNFIVCDDAFGYLNDGADCTAPTGFDNTINASGTGVTLSAGTVSAVSKQATNEWTLTTTGLTTAVDGTVTIEFDPSSSYFSNPDTAYLNGGTQGTYFVHVTLLDGSSDVIDEGTVTSSVAQAIDIETRVKETLKFSVGADAREGGQGTTDLVGPTDAALGGACEPLTNGSSLKIGEPSEFTLSAQQTYNGYSYFRIATNSANGTNVYYAGKTLESGTESIDALASSTASASGTEQFGLRLDTTLHPLNELSAFGTYGGANFQFNDASNTAPEKLAESLATIECDTAGVEYVANIREDTAAGIYTTKITYIASPSY